MVRIQNSTRVLQEFVNNSSLNGDVLRPKHTSNPPKLNVAIAGAKYDQNIMNKISFDKDNNQWGHNINDPSSCDAVRCFKLAKFTEIQFCITLNDPTDDSVQFNGKNVLLNYTSNRGWKNLLKDDGPLHGFKNSIDYFCFEGNHCPGVCYIYSKAYIIIIIIIIIYRSTPVILN